jgi:predicted kinase
MAEGAVILISPPFLIQMSGAPGMGKSTLASGIARRFPHSVVHLDGDIVRSTIHTHADPSLSAPQVAKIAYPLLISLARPLLLQGLTVIIDTPCNFQETLSAGLNLAEEVGSRYRYIWCRHDDMALAEERLRNRQNPLGSQRVGIFEAPRDAVATGGPGSTMDDRDMLEKFTIWMKNPVKPIDRNVIVEVDTKSLGPEHAVKVVIEQLLED